jgi:hypothetical protein
MIRFMAIMMSEFSVEFKVLLCVLAAWRLTHLLVAEDGPFDLVFKLRAWLGDSFFGLVMDCFYCASVWLAFPFAFLVSHDVPGVLLSWLAISGAASLLEQASQGQPARIHSSPPPDPEAHP